MPIILVVDDSKMDRVLIGELLRKADVDWLVSYAEHGAEALELVPELCPNVVVTDMIMPEMDGLEFLASMTEKHPETPVVLISGHGNERIAVEALEKGAASYVPKSNLSERLSETVKQVLGTSHSDEKYKRLIESLDENIYRFRLENDPSLISELVGLIHRRLVKMKICDESTARRVGIAVDEAVINAMYHGNLELPPEHLNEVRNLLRQGEKVERIDERRAEPIFCDRRVSVEAIFTTNNARITVRDEGSGFQVVDIPEAGDPESLERTGGRGHVLMANLVDHLAFNERGNEVTLTLNKRT